MGEISTIPIHGRFMAAGFPALNIWKNHVVDTFPTMGDHMWSSSPINELDYLDLASIHNIHSSFIMFYPN